MRKHIAAMTLMGLMAFTLSANNPTVYKSLGGKKAITAVVDEFPPRTPM